MLHGAGADARAAVSFGYPQYLAAAVKAGLAPFAAVSVDGSSTYWHRRADGDDPLGMIVHEILPRLSRCRYDIKKIGLIGWSMGGYGALLLASTLGPSRVAAVAASSPAVFGSYAAAVPGAFDGPTDFAANDVASPARLGVLRQLPVRIDCGTDDPFAPRASSLRRELGNPPGAISGGCHDEGTMRRALPAELAFLGQRLSR